MLTTRHAVFAGAALVGMATAATSAVSLFRLAEQCSITGPLAASLPIALDVGATVGTLAWITERGPVRSWGRGIAVASLVASLAGNGMQHAIAAGLLRPTLTVVLAVGASIPAALWAVAHLCALMARPPGKTDQPHRRSARTAPAPVATAATAAAASADEVRTHRGARDDRVSWLRDQPTMAWSKQVEAIEQRFGVSRSTAKRVVQAAGRAS